MRRHRLLVTAATGTALVVSGCGITNPYANTATTTSAHAATTTTPRIDHDPSNEQNGTIPASARNHQKPLAADAATSTPQAALARFARLYINWSAPDVPAAETELATISLGAARAQALQAAASYRRDTTLLKSQVVNSGNVVAITEGRGAAAGEWVVVTREQTTGKGDYEGLPAQLHVTFAQLTKRAHGWVVSSWSPQS